MAALGNVLLAWFNACLSWKVVWQSDSDLLDGSDGGVLLHQTRGRDPTVINDCATTPWREKKAFKADTPLTFYMSYFYLLTGLRTNQYVFCWHTVTKTSLPAEINIQCARSGVEKGPMKVYILYEQGAVRLRWRQIMMTGYKRHISFLHNYTVFRFIRILNSLPCELFKVL